MGRTKDFKAIESMLREISQPDYENLCNFLGLAAPELRILDLRYRQNVYKPTREYVAEEMGMSVSTLDRKIKAILKRIAKYAHKVMAELSLSNN